MKTLLPLLSIFLITCTQVNSSKSNSANADSKNGTGTHIPQVNKQFQAFLDQLPTLDLPIKIKGCEIDHTGLIDFTETPPGPYLTEPCFAVGQLKTNGTYISIITLGLADCLLPTITNYKPSGEQIDSKTIAIGSCGNAPCFECEEFMTLKSDYTLYTADTIKTADCDAEYSPIPGTEKIKVVYREGSLKTDGRIVLSEEKEKQLK